MEDIWHKQKTTYVKPNEDPYLPSNKINLHFGNVKYRDSKYYVKHYQKKHMQKELVETEGKQSPFLIRYEASIKICTDSWRTVLI